MKTESIFFVVPESIESNQLSSSGIKHEPRDDENECHDLNQLSTPIEFLNIKNESYDASDATPRTADLKFFRFLLKKRTMENSKISKILLQRNVLLILTTFFVTFVAKIFVFSET